MRRPWIPGVLLALAALPAWAGGDDPAGPPAAKPAAPAPKPAAPPSLAAAADAVLLAWRGNDPAAMKALAEGNDADPWLLVDALCERNEHDAAAAFSKAAPRPDVEALPAYVEKQRTGATSAERRAALEAATAALGARDAARAIATLEAVPADAADVAGMLAARVRARALRSLGKTRESASASRAAAEAAERAGWLEIASRNWANAGEAALEVPDLGVAAFAAEHDLTLAERRGDPTTRRDAIGRLALVRLRAGASDDAAALFERALTLSREIGDRYGEASTLLNLGAVAFGKGDMERARERFEACATLATSIQDSLNARRALQNLGVVQQTLGELRSARETFERVAALAKEADDVDAEAAALGNLAQVHLRLGAAAKSIELLHRARRLSLRARDRGMTPRIDLALAEAKKTLGEGAEAQAILEKVRAEAQAAGDPVTAAAALAALGTLFGTLGDWDRSVEAMKAALHAYASLGRKLDEAALLGDLGVSLALRGDWDAAADHAERAMHLHETLGRKGEVAIDLVTLARVERGRGRPASAVEMLRRALAIDEERGARLHAASVRAVLGSALAAAGDARGAEEVLDRAAREADSLRAPAIFADALAEQAVLRLAAGDPTSALALAQRAKTALEQSLSSLGDEQGSLARARVATTFQVGAEAAAALGRTADLFAFLEAGRAGSLLEALGGRESLRGTSVPKELRSAETEARAAVAEAAAAFLNAGTREERDAVRKRAAALDEARRLQQEVVERIQQEAKRQTSVAYPRAATLEDVEGRLAEGDALVVYGLFGRRALACVVTRGGGRTVSLGPSEDVEAACAEVARAIEDAKDSDAAIRRLRDAVVTPLGLGPDLKRVLVSPDGPLAYAPFAALVPDRVVALLPSATTYVLLADDTTPSGEGVLAVGDPAYPPGSRLAPLPGTRAEATAVGDLVLLGADATKDGLVRALATRRRWHAVHLACHGVVDPRSARRSGLALAPSAGGDGLLTATDVLRLSIPADLAVLSACETVKGRIVPAEGVLGFVRAFLFAGPPRVIVSAWKVDDDATLALMTAFYAAWRPKDGSKPLRAAAALRRAQDAVRSEPRWAHPRFWAAWSLWGIPD